MSTEPVTLFAVDGNALSVFVSSGVATSVTATDGPWFATETSLLPVTIPFTVGS